MNRVATKTRSLVLTLSLAILISTTPVHSWKAPKVHNVASENVYIKEDGDRIPEGMWKGQLPSAVRATYSHITDEGEEVLWNGRVEQVSEEPRIFLLHDFLSEEEADHIISLAEPQMARSSVVDSSNGGSVDSEVRTSSGTFLQYQQTDTIARIEKRISLVTHLPEDNQESIQVLRYHDGEKYEPHMDSFHDPYNTDPKHGGQRMATILMYLSTPEEGGETTFPYAKGPKATGPEFSECARNHLSVKAKKGLAVLFYSLKPNLDEDLGATHGSCPTTKSVKWAAPVWVHTSRFDLGRPRKLIQGAAGDCEDDNALCAGWAAKGECDANPQYMWSNCKRSCNKCGTNGVKDVLGRRIGAN